MSEEVEKELEEATDNHECGAGNCSGCNLEAINEEEKQETPEEQRAQLEAEVASLNDKLLRNAAEVENFKKRMNDERIKESKYRSQSLVTSIIPAIDTFDRALALQPDNEEVKNFLSGFEMVRTQLMDALVAEGVEPIKAKGETFDPNLHQAVMQEEIEGIEAGIVTCEMQKGYMLKDRVVRPSMVKVSQ